MAKIDRTQQEKTFKIGPWKVKLGTICVWALIIVLTLSSVGYYVGSRGNQQTGNNGGKERVQLELSFGDSDTITKLIAVEKGKNAFWAFKEIANMTTEETASGVFPISITYGNLSKTKNSTNTWLFYVNGGIFLKGIDQYVVSDGDFLQLKYMVAIE